MNSIFHIILALHLIVFITTLASHVDKFMGVHKPHQRTNYVFKRVVSDTSLIIPSEIVTTCTLVSIISVDDLQFIIDLIRTP